MRVKFGLIALTLIAGSLCTSGCGNIADIEGQVAVLETNYGKIVIEFLPQVAPKHVRNFINLASTGFYDGTRFHRIVRDKNLATAIQGGDPNTINGDPAIWGQGQRAQRTVPAELSTMIHDRGIVSAARRADDLNSATSQFFICLTRQPGFDGQYSIFGRVIDGMNVVDSIGRAPLVVKTDRPADPVVISRAYVVSRAELK